MSGLTRGAADPEATTVEAAAQAAIKTIPPLWPLSASVAVNPFLGQTSEPVEIAAARWSRLAGTAMTMPRAWYEAKIADGQITQADLATALAAAAWAGKPCDVATLNKLLRRPVVTVPPLPTVADLAADVSNIDWPAIIADRIGHWAAGYFDDGQALWRVDRKGGAYVHWRTSAIYDLTPEILGMEGFARFVSNAPQTSLQAIKRSSETLALEFGVLEGVYARALVTQGGWAQYARYLQFQAELTGSTDDTALDILAIRLLWDEALLVQYGEAMAAGWRDACSAHARPLEPSDDHHLDAIFQHAAEIGAQRSLSVKLANPVDTTSQASIIQAAFCIDVRSEIFRRALEAIDPRVMTLGFAGFFGIATAHRRFASDIVEKRLPVLLNPGAGSVADGTASADLAQRYRARAARAWGRFKLAAVSSFAFVEAAGPLYLAKLVRDALGKVKAQAIEPKPRFDPPLPIDARIDAAETVLRAMSLTKGFAPLVLLVGHGARVTNNPHSAGLQCGACGGYSGDVNARLLAGILNDRNVREGLLSRKIAIPPETLFVGALHDTTTHNVIMFDTEAQPNPHRLAIEQARKLLDLAAADARAESAAKLPHASDGDALFSRAGDWSETRPEWGLAGARAFIAAPRHRTRGRSLEGQIFLHDYDWRADAGFAVLELILTAPVVVASWISLQYYGSAVAPDLFGGGNKLLHNITGGIGVVEGNGGVLRGGLPWQSVHDGKNLIHDPLRLTVCIEAPSDAIDAILLRHPEVRALFDNRWMHLVTIDDSGRIADRYRGVSDWQGVAEAAEAAEAMVIDGKQLAVAIA